LKRFRVKGKRANPQKKGPVAKKGGKIATAGRGKRKGQGNRVTVGRLSAPERKKLRATILADQLEKKEGAKKSPPQSGTRTILLSKKGGTRTNHLTAYV